MPLFVVIAKISQHSKTLECLTPWSTDLPCSFVPGSAAQSQGAAELFSSSQQWRGLPHYCSSTCQHRDTTSGQRGGSQHPHQRTVGASAPLEMGCLVNCRGGGTACGLVYLMQRETPSSLSWQYGQAKQTYLLACKNSASCLTWLGVGIACYRVSAITFRSSVL